MKPARLGALPPRYSFVLNPYADAKISRCPLCGKKTGQRKVPLLIHVDPGYPIALNYTRRYCKECDLLVASKIEIEHLLTEMCRDKAPAVIGNQYLIIGTVEKKAWRDGMKKPMGMLDALKHLSDFAKYFAELRCTRPGYYREGEKPPLLEPPESQEWVRAHQGQGETRRE